jgi:hypothetical protein
MDRIGWGTGTLIEMVHFSPLIRKSLQTAGLKTTGEIRTRG